MTLYRSTHRTSRLTALGFLAALLTTASTPIPQQAVAVVGQVTNGTAGSTVPESLPITLHAFTGAEETGVYTAALAADGSFRFDGLAPEEGETFIVYLVYQDVAYFSDIGVFEAGAQQLSLPVTIYETTEDPSTVQITQLHLFLAIVGDRIRVEEVYLIGNTGDRTYVGAQDAQTGQRTTLTFTMPQGAENVEFDDPGLDERYLELEEGFADTEPVLPGSATVEVSFGYELPHREEQQVERSFDAPVASVVLAPMGEGLTLEGEGLTLLDARDTEGWPPLSYTAGPLAAGERLAFVLARRPEVGSGAAEGGRGTGAAEAAVGLAALAIAIAATILLWRSPSPGPLPAQARPLVEAIAALDRDFEAGGMPEKVYCQERESLRQRLHALLDEQQGSGGAGVQR